MVKKLKKVYFFLDFFEILLYNKVVVIKKGVIK